MHAVPPSQGRGGINTHTHTHTTVDEACFDKHVYVIEVIGRDRVSAEQIVHARDYATIIINQPPSSKESGMYNLHTVTYLGGSIVKTI